MPAINHTVWSQWPDLVIPEGFTKFSLSDFPLDSSDLSKITIYIPPYMTGVEFLEPIKGMTNLQLVQVPNAGYESALPYIRDGIRLCNARGVTHWFVSAIPGVAILLTVLAVSLVGQGLNDALNPRLRNRVTTRARLGGQ